ncbi:AAA family ATPase [Phascolarctobacterium sp.]
MLKDITKIKISGAIFDTPVTLDFFNPHEGDKLKTVKGALLYGRNGTGKSTIARAFRKIAGENILVISSAVAYDIEDQYVMLNEEDKKHIFIFDEDYIQKNVRLQQDHLETIVMLGHAADLTEKIKEAETERDKAKTDYERQVDVFKEYCDSSNVKSPKYCILSLVNSLRGDDNWSGRDREIMGGRQNTSVREDTYKKFVKLMPAKQKTELIVDYKVKREELQAAQTGATTIDIKVPSLSKLYSDYDDKTVQMLLAMKIEKPELSEREQKLFALVQRRKSEELSQRLIILRNKDTMQCPYCFQLLQQEYRESLVKSIEKVLNEAVKDHQSVLQKNVFAIIDLNLDPFEKLSGYKECVDLIELVNTMILGNNENLKSKIENPYTPIDTQTTDVKALVPQLIKAVEDLEKVREMYNKAAKKTDTIVFEMNRINSEIAHYDVKVLSTLLEKQQEEYDAAEKLLKELKAIYDVGKKAVEKLESERKNIRLALDSINACMKYIFFADDRLKIEYVDGVYKLLSHGKNVNPCDVSVGERNIIGLSYFFTSIFENQEEKDAYGKEYLIVVDDPVSSFDMENKIGILSF